MDAHTKREKIKARELRASSWWRQQIGPGLCYYCKNKFSSQELTMDHVIPIARGGKTNKKNCVPCCKECNNKKSYKTVAELKMDEVFESNSKIENSNEPTDD